MKRSKIALAALVVTVSLVASFAFTSKPVSLVIYEYTTPSGDFVTQKGVSGSIVPGELIADAQPDGVPDNWTLRVSLSHAPGTELLGIEFESTQFTLQQAVAEVHSFYTAPGSPNDPLPTDGAQIVQPVTLNTITYYKF